MYSIDDFPPVALFVSELKKINVANISQIKKTLQGLIKPYGLDGTNTDKFFIQSLVNWVENDNNIAELYPEVKDFTTDGVNFMVREKLIPHEFFTHCERFKLTMKEAFDWIALMVDTVGADNFAQEDVFYITAVHPKIDISAYRLFLKNPNTLDERFRIKYSSIIAFNDLKNELRKGGEVFSGFNVFCLADAFSTADIVELLSEGYHLDDVVLYNRLGLKTVSEIKETANDIPHEWIDMVRDNKA